MRKIVHSVLSAFLVLVFASMGVLAQTGEPIVFASDKPLGLTADSAADACCDMDMDEDCPCCSSAADDSCCSEKGHDCNDCASVQVMIQLAAYLTSQDGMVIPADEFTLTTIPDQRPEDALLLSIDHVPKHSLS